MNVSFWVDPACPWCWMTARWAVDVVTPARDLTISWEPISLLFKNEPAEHDEYYAANQFTHRLLRVMQAVNEGEGSDAARLLYWQYGAVLHHDRVAGTADEAEVLSGGAEPFLEAAGMPSRYAEAYDDESWDETIRTRMQVGLGLVGGDVGTPDHRLRHARRSQGCVRADHQPHASGRRRRRDVGRHGQARHSRWVLGAQANPY